jgi:MFS family permease
MTSSASHDADASATGVRAALLHADFRRYVWGRFFGTIAWQMLGVAVGWQVYSITGDPLDLGLVGLAQFLPFFALVLPSGQWADRTDRRLIIIGAYVIETICAIILIGFTLSGSQTVWPVFLAMALFGAGRALWMPSSQAMIINLVPNSVLPAAVAFNSSLFQVAVIAGPSIGGVLYALGELPMMSAYAGSLNGGLPMAGGFGALLVYTIAALMLMTVIFLMIRVKPVRAKRVANDTGWRTIFEGLRFVWQKKPVLGAISLDLFAVLFGGATALLPVFAADVLHVGPEGLGILRTAPGVGAAVTAIWLARRPIARHAGSWMFGGVALFGVATIVFGLSTSFWLSCAALFLLGVGDMVSVFVRHLLVQLETPDAIRGRVSAVNALFIGASNELGEFESGLTARWWGAVPAVVVGGVLCLGVVGAYLRLFPQLRVLDRFPDPATARDD